jgi:hypothetical protein
MQQCQACVTAGCLENSLFSRPLIPAFYTRLLLPLSRYEIQTIPQKHYLQIYDSIITNSVGHSSSWEAHSHSIGQEIPCLLRNPNFHYRVHKTPSLDPFWATVMQSTTPQLFLLWSILILSSSQHLGLPCVAFHSDFRTNILYSLLILRMRSTCPLISSSFTYKRCR